MFFLPRVDFADLMNEWMNEYNITTQNHTHHHHPHNHAFERLLSCSTCCSVLEYYFSLVWSLLNFMKCKYLLIIFIFSPWNFVVSRSQEPNNISWYSVRRINVLYLSISQWIHHEWYWIHHRWWIHHGWHHRIVLIVIIDQRWHQIIRIIPTVSIIFSNNSSTIERTRIRATITPCCRWTLYTGRGVTCTTTSLKVDTS